MSPDGVRRYVKHQYDQTFEAVASLQNRLVPLGQFHNSVAPVNGLPPEIFCEIFLGLSDNVGDVSHVIAASHVCHRWRSIALNAPKLWSAFQINRTDAISVFLQRSRSLPIDLYLTKPSDRMHHIAYLISPHVSRIRTLWMAYPSAERIDAFFSRFHIVAPILERLSLWRMDIVDSTQPPRPPHGSLVYLSVLPAPSLRTLRLHNMSFLPRLAGPTVLVNPEIRQNFSPDQMCTLRDMVSLLRQCNLLESLIICGVPLMSSNLPPSLVAVLPHLKILEVANSATSMEELLAYLSIPIFTVIRLQTRDFPWSLPWDTTCSRNPPPPASIP
ncbi:hypothetical protein C8Q78DRAFT_265944 [Trametes maxima]|nr:hypothetical protein C8Q78DRAFT_265944 [Trametes maxima]